MSGAGERIVVIGGGGHARVVIEILLCAGWAVVGYTDAGAAPLDAFGSIRCLGDDHVLPELRTAGVGHAIVAVGDNVLRGRLAGKAALMGFSVANAIHPSSQISPSAQLGCGIAVMALSVINAATVIGDNTIVNTGATVDHDCQIGRDVHIAPGARLAGRVVVADRALIGVGAVVGRGRNLSIGEDAVVGAGAVVISDVPPRTTVVGNPARRASRRGG
jgi:UDP-perosamine 4-acetyltransferase